MATLFLAIGLLILIMVNIILGSMKGFLNKSFDWDKCRKGIYKNGIIFICLTLVYLAGYLNQDIIAIEVGELKVNLMQATYYTILASYLYYAADVIKKISKNLKSGTINAEKPPDIK
ncbi:MAG: hypothetical protein A2Y15_08765 [Clostridiales bacterium GWF2_36_10]|nr:MAG: hypothetical protein A2Y15_08765 [Clostridiales bacterium GWF2_36_10]HAN20435.1 hypothetical protein [Clostridiales bacterium]